jgi:CRP-like cAMP-binding protein
MKSKTYRAGEKIIAEGTQGRETYLIQSGVVLVCKETGQRSPIPIARLSKGEVFGEMYLLDAIGFRTATAIAESEVVVDVLSEEEMNTYLEQTPEIMRSILTTACNRLAQTSQECALLKFKQQAFSLKGILQMVLHPVRTIRALTN